MGGVWGETRSGGSDPRGDHHELSGTADAKEGVLVEISIGGDEPGGEERPSRSVSPSGPTASRTASASAIRASRESGSVPVTPRISRSQTPCRRPAHR